MNSKPKSHTFSIRYALGIITMTAVASALLGMLVRRDAQSRAESARRIEVYNENASTIADQIAATKRVVEQERKLLEPLLDDMDGYPKNCRSGQSNGTSGWKYELKTATDQPVVALRKDAFQSDGYITNLAGARSG